MARSYRAAKRMAQCAVFTMGAHARAARAAGFAACAAQYPGGLAVFDPLNDCFSKVSCP
jgi:hypothetical protein